MFPTILHRVSLLALGAAVAGLAACAAESSPPTASVNWNSPSDPTAASKPLMRLAALPMNPAPPAPYADHTQEPTRFTFQPRPVIVDQGNGVEEVQSTDVDQGGQE
jgi:hypothetical protein